MIQATDVQPLMFFAHRSSILSEVTTRSRSKLPAGKNVLVLGEYDSLVLFTCLCCLKDVRVRLCSGFFALRMSKGLDRECLLVFPLSGRFVDFV